MVKVIDLNRAAPRTIRMLAMMTLGEVCELSRCADHTVTLYEAQRSRVRASTRAKLDPVYDMMRARIVATRRALAQSDKAIGR